MKKNGLLFGYIFLMFASCANDSKYSPATSGGGKILLPENLEVYNSGLRKEAFNPGNKTFPLKIFTTINVSCATCILKLEKWKEFQAEADSCSGVLLVPVCTAKDKFELIKYLIEDNRIKGIGFPLLFDSTRAFGKLNKQFSDEMSGVSVLTDSDNTILLSGNPIENAGDKQQFLEKICHFNK